MASSSTSGGTAEPPFNIITLDGERNRLKAWNHGDTARYPKSRREEPQWRFLEDSEPVIPRETTGRDRLPDECLTKTAEIKYMRGAPAWFVEVGLLKDANSSDGRFVWRSTFAKPSAWTKSYMSSDHTLQEPEALKKTMAEIHDTFAALRSKHGIESENDTEILRDLGLFVESRLEHALQNVTDSRQGGRSNVVHIVPADYALLEKDLKVKSASPASAYRYDQTDGFDRLDLWKTEDSASAPKWFQQVYGTKIDPRPNMGSIKDSTKYLQVAVDVQKTLAGKVTTDCSAVMPWDAGDVKAVPDWFVDMLSGRGEHSERWRDASTQAVRGFKEFNKRVEDNKVWDMDLAVLKFVDPRQGEARALRHFICSALQRELESIVASAPDSSSGKGDGKRRALVPRVSSMNSDDIPHRHSLDNSKKTGMFPSDIFRDPLKIELLCRVIDESVKFAEEASKAKEREEELETIRHEAQVAREHRALDRVRGAPPSYSDTAAGSSSAAGGTAVATLDADNYSKGVGDRGDRRGVENAEQTSSSANVLQSTTRRKRNKSFCCPS